MAESIYLYYSNNEFLLNHKIEEKIVEFNVDPFNVIKYDLLENASDDILEDLQTVSFFAEEKVIIVRNLAEIEKEGESVVKNWISYLEKPNPDVILLIVQNELLKEDTPLGGALFKFAYIEKIKDCSARMKAKFNAKLSQLIFRNNKCFFIKVSKNWI